jgi:hypothetical protein
MEGRILWNRAFFTALLAVVTECLDAHADGAAAKNDPVEDKEDHGSWQPLGPPYPNPQNVPGHEDGSAQTLRESFELACKGQGSDSKELRLQIQVSDSGYVDVRETGSVSASEVRAQVYMNAILWRVLDDTYVVDRFSGKLTIKPGPRSYQCAKIGGRKF